MIVHLISSPRTMSTALLYAFVNRLDFVGIDEPLYARYLDMTGLNHPGAEAIMSSQSLDQNEIFEHIESLATNDKHVFIKNMASHLDDVVMNLYSQHKNIILFRDPAKIISSFGKVIQELTLSDIGIQRSCELFKRLKSCDADVVAVHADHLIEDPVAGLETVCTWLGIDVTERMLNWPVGPKDVDGVWAPYWYHRVHQSTGLRAKKNEPILVPVNYKHVYDEAQPYYKYLLTHAII